MLYKKDFTAYSGEIMDWIANYLQNIKKYKVKSSIYPGEIYKNFNDEIPKKGCEFIDIINEIDEKIMPGITHWQHPNFHAFFPGNGSIESLFGEFITAAIGAQCMIWDTSPAAAELEQRMMEWLGKAIGIPNHWEGVIQDTASSATLVALITAREKTCNFKSNDYGVPNNLRVYASSETHSSIEKAMGISGMGRKNLVYIPVDSHQSIRMDLLEKAIQDDTTNGLKPCAVVATLGTTGTLAIDSIPDITSLCEKYNIWCHIDAAYAGSALLLPEYQHLIKGIEKADSFVFNPHKWLFTNFDCSAYFIKDVNSLIKCFGILPEYLKMTSRGSVNDYRDWGIPLGRRFRALKLWFVLKSYGLNGLQEKLRKHIELAQYAADQLDRLDGIDWITPPRLNGIFFRRKVSTDESTNNDVTRKIYNRINASGIIYLSHTKVNDILILRLIFGQTYLEKEDVDTTIKIVSKSWN